MCYAATTTTTTKTRETRERVARTHDDCTARHDHHFCGSNTLPLTQLSCIAPSAAAAARVATTSHARVAAATTSMIIRIQRDRLLCSFLFHSVRRYYLFLFRCGAGFFRLYREPTAFRCTVRVRVHVVSSIRNAGLRGD